MRDALEQIDKVSYYSFLMTLAKHETVNEAIGMHNIELPSQCNRLGIESNFFHVIFFFIQLSEPKVIFVPWGDLIQSSKPQISTEKHLVQVHPNSVNNNFQFSSCVGVLPSKAELLIDPEMDQELDKLWAHTHRNAEMHICIKTKNMLLCH